MRNHTYEVGTDEALHPDADINNRMEEHDVSDCKYGCKLYKDPNSHLIVLGHIASYGCRRTKADILTGPANVSKTVDRVLGTEVSNV